MSAPLVPEPIRGAAGASDLGPRNLARDRENPDLLAPPATDHGTLPNLRFSFSDAHNRLEPGGWAREVTERELPIATTLAGVNMRLESGAVRELHWHKQAEWAYMLLGRARITAVDEEGRSFVDDVGEGDLWYFPAGIPHSIQALEDGCEFLLVFDDGGFSENATFLITDWFAHTPRDVLAKNFGVPEAAFEELPDHERYIVPSEAPGPLASDPRCRAPSARSRGLSAIACWPRSRPTPRAAPCASRTRRAFRWRRRSPRRSWTSSPAPCASCTGIPTPTSGSTTSKAPPG